MTFQKMKFINKIQTNLLGDVAMSPDFNDSAAVECITVQYSSMSSEELTFQSLLNQSDVLRQMC